MKSSILAILALMHFLLSVAQSSEADRPKEYPHPSPDKNHQAYIGVFSNEEQGFYIKTLMLSKTGKGYYSAAGGAIPVLWTYDPQSNIFKLIGPSDGTKPAPQFSVRFDPTKYEFTILDQYITGPSRPLHYVQSDIPEKIQRILNAFDGTTRSLEKLSNEVAK